MSSLKVSIIVPVYKAERYIEECARSLFGQTLDDLEFVFVDDCSPDKSVEVLERILDEYPERKKHTKVIRHGINQGVSQTRQDGVNIATGEYIIHCDPDDWVELDMYERMYTKAIECGADIVGCNYWEEFGDKSISKKQSVRLNSKEIFIDILNGDLHPSLCCRLIRQQFIKENKAVFKSGITLSEDALYVVPLHLKTEKVVWLPESLYHYRMSSSSITHNVGEEQIRSHIYVIKSFAEYCDDDTSVMRAYNCARARAMQALITQPDVYNPKQWLQETDGLDYSCFGTVTHKLSPWLVRHGLNKLNLYIIRIFRLLKR